MDYMEAERHERCPVCPKEQTHVHEVLGSVWIAEAATDPHNHRFAVVTCPYCGTRKPSIEPYAWIIGATMHCIWIAKCRGCPNAVLITTQDDSIKTAIRGWNRYANGGWRKH